MPGTSAGGRKYAETMKAKYGDDYFVTQGRKGGQAVRGPGSKGFGALSPEKLRRSAPKVAKRRTATDTSVRRRRMRPSRKTIRKVIRAKKRQAEDREAIEYGYGKHVSAADISYRLNYLKQMRDDMKEPRPTE